MKNYLEYKESLDKSLNRVVIILNELVHTYPLHLLSPNYKPYLDNYRKDTTNLKKSFHNLILVRKGIERDLIETNKDVSVLDKKLIHLDKENQRLMDWKENMDDDSGAPRELDIVKYKYNEQLAQNIILLLATLFFIGIFIFFLNKKKITKEIDEIISDDLGFNDVKDVGVAEVSSKKKPDETKKEVGTAELETEDY